MSEETLLRELKRLAEVSKSDPLTAHVQADALLLAYIDRSEIAAAFHEIQRWYS